MSSSRDNKHHKVNREPNQASVGWWYLSSQFDYTHQLLHTSPVGALGRTWVAKPVGALGKTWVAKPVTTAAATAMATRRRRIVRVMAIAPFGV